MCPILLEILQKTLQGKMKDKGYIGGCKGMTHLWKSIGDKRTIVFEYKPSDTNIKNRVRIHTIYVIAHKNTTLKIN